MSVRERIAFLVDQGCDLTGLCIVRIFATTGGIVEFLCADKDFALERIDSRRKKWKFFQAATLSVHDGVCWVEISV